MPWVLLLLIHVLLLCLLLLKRRTTRTRLQSEPPLDKGLLPWLGHAFEFGRDASGFLERMKRKHGDIFTVCVAGRYVTVLMDPHSFDAVLGDTERLDFTRYAQVLMERIFCLRLPSRHRPEEAKAVMKTHFQGVNLAALMDATSRQLQVLLRAEAPPNRKDWKEEGLFDFSYRVLFKSGYLTLFGGEQNNNGADPSHVYKEYRKFDGLLTKMARGTLGPEERRTARDVRRRLWDFLTPAGLTEDSGSSPWLYAYRRLLQEDGADEETQRRAALLQLWATQGNVGPAAFWMLAFLLTDAEALAAVRREFSAAAPPPPPHPEMSRLDATVRTPVFDSALEETLRLTAAPFITREVLQEKTLRMADGEEYHLRKGDRVCLFPFTSPQMDGEIHPQPKTFKHRRFLNADGSPKTDFYKAGRRLRYYSMPWGAGANGCVGKRFAINTIRQFVYMVLTHLEMEPCDPEASPPEGDAGRYGFGMLQPRGDLLVRYKARDTS